MTKEKPFFKTTLGKLLLIFIGLFALAFTISKASYYYITSSNPEVIRNAFDGAQSSKEILSKTGEIVSYDYTYNEHDLEKDSLKFHIKLIGKIATATIDAVAVKDSQNQWLICKSDTSFTK